MRVNRFFMIRIPITIFDSSKILLPFPDALEIVGDEVLSFVLFRKLNEEGLVDSEDGVQIGGDDLVHYCGGYGGGVFEPPGGKVPSAFCHGAYTIEDSLPLLRACY